MKPKLLTSFFFFSSLFCDNRGSCTKSLGILFLPEFSRCFPLLPVQLVIVIYRTSGRGKVGGGCGHHHSEAMECWRLPNLAEPVMLTEFLTKCLSVAASVPRFTLCYLENLQPTCILYFAPARLSRHLSWCIFQTLPYTVICNDKLFIPWLGNATLASQLWAATTGRVHPAKATWHQASIDSGDRRGSSDKIPYQYHLPVTRRNECQPNCSSLLNFFLFKPLTV